jgi:photosystem II stability/assembly factor-like uncharacterized protein
MRAALARRTSISPEQRRMVEEITLGGRGVDVVVSRAGTGKTFALDAARDAWESSGVRVVAARSRLGLQRNSKLDQGSKAPPWPLC